MAAVQLEAGGLEVVAAVQRRAAQTVDILHQAESLSVAELQEHWGHRKYVDPHCHELLNR